MDHKYFFKYYLSKNCLFFEKNCFKDILFKNRGLDFFKDQMAKNADIFKNGPGRRNQTA